MALTLLPLLARLIRLVSTALLSNRYRTHRLVFLFSLFILAADVFFHQRSFDVKSPERSLDTPFAKNCVPASAASFGDDPSRYHDPSKAPLDASQPRENATIVMLARNSDVQAAVEAVTSLETQWNKWFNYPILFMNDEPWDEAFKSAMKIAASGEVHFTEVPESMWKWPQGVSRDQAEYNWQVMDAPYATKESYHHMCRFYSGYFQDIPELAAHQYFWRIEPDARFTCRIPYDPFRQMRLNKKIYGYTVALWEIPRTCPSLFREAMDFKVKNAVQDVGLWPAMVDPSRIPSPIRWLMSFLPFFSHMASKSRMFDQWTHCHFWSNFEIADIDFFRSQQYRDFFKSLDDSGGFFLERWGDAPVHSLALALFARPEQLHYFEDIGYDHPPYQHYPDAEVGCDCRPVSESKILQPVCRHKFRKGVDPA